jgi:hypothetical protein
MKIAIIYAVAVTIAELITNLLDPVLGIISYTILLVAIIIHASLSAGKASISSRLVLSLTLVPLIRMISLFMPFQIFAQV